MTIDPWILQVNLEMQQFSQKHSLFFQKRERELCAAFEIGCFHGLVNYYESINFNCIPKNLGENDEYKYLTTPAGNPNNFSYILAKKGKTCIEIRQQVRIRSHVNKHISFTPDLVVLKNKTKIKGVLDAAYANSTKRFFSVTSKRVISLHECKSLQPFPELLISFLGMLFTGLNWYNGQNKSSIPKGVHLAPSLFVGGTCRNLHIRMIKALQKKYPINIFHGIHSGKWGFHFPKINKIK